MIQEGEVVEVKSFINGGVHVTEYHYHGTDDTGQPDILIHSVAKSLFDWRDVVGWIGRNISEVREWHRM
jgi:hypothetical protein